MTELRIVPTKIITDDTCKEEIEARISDLVEILAEFPRADIDPRAWQQLYLYAPKP